MPNPADAEGILELGAQETTSDGAWRTPVYLRARVDLSLAGLAFSAGYDSVADGALLRFVSASGQTPSVSDNSLPGKIALAWLDGWQAKAGDVILLGYIGAGTSRALRFFGASANATNGGRIVRLAWARAE